MNLNEKFKQGLTREAYFATITDLKENVEHIYQSFTVPAGDVEDLQRKENIRAVVIAEGWCGHCMLDVPIFARVAEAANLDYRILPRDEHLDLMDQYLTKEKRFIPIIIFIDQDGNELATWGPMAPGIEQYIDQEKEELPDRDDEAYQEAFATFVKKVAEHFTKDDQFWRIVYTDLKRKIISI